MVKIKEQLVDTEDVCEAVLAKVFGEDALYDLDTYDKYSSIIEETCLYLKGDN